VLGPTGYNFAAGMSGGIACVYDPDRRLPIRLNLELVELESMEEDDFRVSRRLIKEHLARTGSTVAQRIVDDWETSKHAFKKVMPRAFKQALAGVVPPPAQLEPTETAEPEKASV
jgi:glutamate synthase domain-containing protein 3